MALRVVMLGPPGAGKGTQAKRICDAHGLVHISTGDIFRSHLSRGTELGKKAQGYMDAGQLVPDELTCELVAARIAEADCEAGYVLDGFPRSVPQAETFARILTGRSERLDVAINIEVPDEEIVGRLTQRRTCSQCGAIYNLKYDTFETEGRCNKCGGELTLRKDDQPETIRERLRVYHETTEPIIAFYEKVGILRTIEGAGIGPDTIFDKIESILSTVKSEG